MIPPPVGLSRGKIYRGRRGVFHRDFGVFLIFLAKITTNTRHFVDRAKNQGHRFFDNRRVNYQKDHRP